MTDYEHNAQVEIERAEYHRKRSEESRAYKAVCNGLIGLYKASAEQNKRLISAVNSQSYTITKEEMQMATPTFLTPGYFDALREFAEAEKKFDAKLIKKNGFEW